MRGLRRWSCAAFVGVVAAACAPPPSERAVDDGLNAVQEAILAQLPGATEAPGIPGNWSQKFPGRGAAGGKGIVTGAMIRTARTDWSSLLPRSELGVAALVLAQADAVADVLRGHGFEPFDADASVFKMSGAPDIAMVSVATVDEAGNGHTSEWSAPRDVDRLVHRRLYRAPGTGAFVVSRIEYDGRTRVAEVELTYVEATVRATYPESQPQFTETIAAAPKKR